MNPDKKPYFIQYTIKLPTMYPHPQPAQPKFDVEDRLVEATLQGMTERGSFPDVKKMLLDIAAK